MPWTNIVFQFTESKPKQDHFLIEFKYDFNFVETIYKRLQHFVLRHPQYRAHS